MFYSPGIETDGLLDSIESEHVVKVLRKKVGDFIHVTDGAGGWFSCRIITANPKSCKVEIIESDYHYNQPETEIYIAICPTKNSSRIEYFVEKSVEIGISGIYFIKTQNTYPQRINQGRLEKIAVSAMKQSLKAYKPFISELTGYDDFLSRFQNFDQKYIAHLSEQSIDISSVKPSRSVLVMIGPEGDFSDKELEIAFQTGFKNITLGKNRLRTETAGIFAVSVLNSNAYK